MEAGEAGSFNPLETYEDAITDATDRDCGGDV